MAMAAEGPLGLTDAVAGERDDQIVAIKENVFDFNAKAFDKRVGDADWDQAKYNVDNMDAAIKKIQKLDPDYDVSKLAKRFDDAKRQLAAHRAKVQRGAAHDKQARAMKRKHRVAISLVEDLNTGTENRYGTPRQEREIKKIVRALHDLGDVERLCKDDALNHPACELAAKRKTIAKAVLDHDLELFVAERVKAIKGFQEALATDGTITSESSALFDTATLSDKLSARYTELGAFADSPVPIERFAPILEAAKAFAAEFPKAERVSRLPKGFAAAPKTVVADVKATFRDANVKRVVIRKSWNVAVNDFRIPVKRDTAGAALLQHPGESFCRLKRFLAVQVYKGGKYGVVHVDLFRPEYQVCSCK
ncbi:MAG: hypothetical protein HYY84_13330 [Deltaproteobacteria bacterium]|nr:hypothetical protein [Deltaproteobacteria bacterium]